MTRDVQFAVVGDLTLDITVQGPAPVPGADHPATITLSPGGQGANVAVRLARQGASVRLVSAVGSDWAGQQLEGRMATEGVELRNLGADRSGTVFVSLADGSGERAMLSDRATFTVAGRSEEWREALADAGWIHLSGYVLADGAAGQAMADLVQNRRPDQRLSVGGGSFYPAPDLAARLRSARPDLVHVDRSEALAVLEAGAGGHMTAAELAAGLAEVIGAIVVVTDGAAGAAAAIGGDVIVVDATAAPVVDATGAGDAHAAAVLVSLASGSWPPSRERLRSALLRGGQLGAEAAGLVGAQARTPSEETA